MFTGDQVMFEIYREAGYDRRFKVVYFTELNEHNRETEINRRPDRGSLLRRLHHGLAEGGGQGHHRAAGWIA